MHMSPPSLRKPNIPPWLGSFCGFDCKAPTSMCSSGEYIQGNCYMVCHGEEKELKTLVISFLTHLATLVFRSNRSFTSLLPKPVPTRTYTGSAECPHSCNHCFTLQHGRAQNTGLGSYPSFLHPVHDSKENTISDSKTSWRFLLRPQIFSQSPP